MPRKNQKPESAELPVERQARRLRAKLEVMQLKEVERRLKGALNIHAAADVGRRNRDWLANNSSADLAIIPDSTVLNGRARQLDRDSWIVRSYKRAFKRNVVGKGITVNPHARDKDGKPLVALNKVAQEGFSIWCRTAAACDVEKRKTFAQFQRLAAGEKAVVGEHLWMWAYTPSNSMRPVGLRLQAFEPEQFDLRILSFEGREVRGGVEVDENGAPVAYHIYTRNPNDVLYRHAFFSERVPRERMFHYYDQERVLQTRGVTPLAPVMSDVRDLDRFRSATLWRTIMESCIGLIIKGPVPGNGQGPSPGLPLIAGDSAQTSSGMEKFDFVPGMVARPVPGEDIEPFMPQSPGNQYDPFTQLTVRGIGAGVGMSFGQIMRHSDGNYSSARQDMLEDRKEQEPEHELIIDCLIRPTYELWFNFAALEGRFDDVDGFDFDDFLANRHRYMAADYIPPSQTWIDPEKEANAYAILLANRLITREEIVAMRGGRFYQIVQKIAAEQAETDELGLSLPENEEDRKELRQIIQAWYASRLGVLDNAAANATDIEQLIEKARIPTRKFKQTDLPIVSQVPPKPAPTASPGDESAASADPATKAATAGVAPEIAVADTVDSPVVPPEVPNYQDAADPVVSCATCSFLRSTRCTKFNFETQLDKVCDAWMARSLTENIGVPNVAKTFPPGPQPGQRDLERRFYPSADTTPRP